ncbi:hypothetical protein [Pontibacter sp. HSC-36F09]|uniref:hypothetical protein n=1 Tax=Pontibacter sp. HSC-36F09 TaxID=2910966 RepID=UPI00209FC075|nr:hypothetical protein [Pontibacter sp. HSC-36F09]MCP2043126.1 chemotaxis protein histidine kinase CheA [Pontibacter sp. HSC-36F09]
MKKISYLAAAIAFFGFASLDASAQTDKNKKKSKKKQKVEQTTEVETETNAETENQVNYEQQAQTETQVTTATQTQTTTQTAAQDDKEKREAITKEELPEPVQQALTAEAFSSWQIVEVFRVTPNANAAGANAQGMENRAEQANQNAQNVNAQANAQGQGAKTMYEIFFTNEQQQSAKVRIDEKGNIIQDQK